jgi:hypothetical protein
MTVNEITEDEVVEPLICDYCSNEGEEYDVRLTPSSEKVCNDCGYYCERCGESGHSDDGFNVVDGMAVWCSECSINEAYYCNYYRHGEYHTSSEYYISDAGQSWCAECCETHAHWCENCDEYTRDYCECESGDDGGTYIHDYSYKPDPVFYSTDDENTRLYFGIEIEVEAKGSDYETRRDAAEYAYRLEDAYDLAYLKSDGSLTCGFEIVTHPMTHAYFKNEAQELWNTTDKLKEDMNMMSWGTKTCGIHIHISRAGFAGGAHQHRFLQLIYHNKDFYSELAGRESDNWAKFTDVLDYRTGKPSFAKKIKNHRDTDRYSAVNTINRHTLEMRIFRGSLNQNFIKASIDLAHASVEYTRVMSLQEIKDGALTPSAFMGYILANADLYADLIGRMSRIDLLVLETKG